MEEDLTFSKDELPEDVSLVIVDDDAPFLQRLSRAMEQRGFDVRTASSVSDGTPNPVLLARPEVPWYDALCESLDDRSFSDTRLSDKHRIVFRPAGQYLDDAPDFVVPANDRIQFPRFGALVQVNGIFLQCLVAIFCRPAM